jgi:hypothetical protein
LEAVTAAAVVTTTTTTTTTQALLEADPLGAERDPQHLLTVTVTVMG